MSQKIRVPRTIAMFVRLLGDIIRNKLGLRVLEHEHWEFKQVAKWETTYTVESVLPEGLTWEKPAAQNYLPYEATNFRMASYVAIGEVGTRVGRVMLRAIIQESDWVAAGVGKLWLITLWSKSENGNVVAHCFNYALPEDVVYLDERIPKPLPPNRIAFWREKESQVV